MTSQSVLYLEKPKTELENLMISKKSQANNRWEMLKNRVPVWQWVTKIFNKGIGTDEGDTSSKSGLLLQKWQNWSKNIVYESNEPYYFMPQNDTELREALQQARQAKEYSPNLTVRVSGQRHSQPPLVIHDNRDVEDKLDMEKNPPVFLVDMSCYADDATGGERLLVDPGNPNRVIMNSGVREDELENFLKKNDLMMKTVTAGGSFSLGGITAVDAHGATVEEGIFAETVYSFTIMNANGEEITIDEDTQIRDILPKCARLGDNWSPIQFARVSLGGLGIVTSIKLNVQPRPYQETLLGGTEWFQYCDEPSEQDYFVNNTLRLLMGEPGEEDGHERLEVFFNPYKEMRSNEGFLALFWDVQEDPDSKTDNTEAEDVDVCGDANSGEGQYGSPILPYGFVQSIGWQAQFPEGQTLRTAMMSIFMTAIEILVGTKNEEHLELWYTIHVPPVIFMSYFIPLSDIGPTGLGEAWEALNVVAEKVRGEEQHFYITGPM
ncbi:MAG: FAD-binding protein, partial [Symploca sp. SIO3E6]|nr:FAD-binding protein [Caldora sp. SIO3E6]